MAAIEKIPMEQKSRFTANLKIPTGKLADKRLGMTFVICDSPTCECTDVYIDLLLT